eukprot:Skav201484  [mRNA]  locus=scaffold828:220161:223742:- [translate_table: standard]
MKTASRRNVIPGCASVTVAFMMQVEQGKVRLDDPVAKFLPAFADVQALSLEDFTNRLAKVPLRFHPGDAYAYGFSTDVLGRVLEVLCGKSLEEVLAESLFRPLGMDDTSFAVPNHKLHRLAACYGSASTWGRLYGSLSGKAPRVSRAGLVRLDGDCVEDSAWREGRQCKIQCLGASDGFDTLQDQRTQKISE